MFGKLLIGVAFLVSLHSNLYGGCCVGYFIKGAVVSAATIDNLNEGDIGGARVAERFEEGVSAACWLFTSSAQK